MNRIDVPFEFKSMEDDTSTGIATFEGYASTFGNVDRVGDYLVKGAFGNDIKAKNIPILWNHDSNQVLGGYKSLKEDEKGLFVKGELNLGVTKAVEARALMKAGHLRHMSIGYATLDDEWDPELRARALKKVNLFEVSLTAIPANLKAGITDVKNSGKLMTVREFEGFLRDAGLSANEAKCVVSRGYSQLLREKTESELFSEEAVKSLVGSVSGLTDFLKELNK